MTHPRRLTGNYYFKPTLISGLVLLVEIEVDYLDDEGRIERSFKEFIKADLTDAFELGLASSNTISLAT
jgi:hypothetical protein